MPFDWNRPRSRIVREGSTSWTRPGRFIPLALLCGIALGLLLPGAPVTSVHQAVAPVARTSETAIVPRPTSLPPAAGDQGLAYDYADHYLLLFDGATTPTQTWAYQGGNWRQVDVGGTAPSQRGLVQGQMTWDPFDGYVMLWSGNGGTTDTWAWQGDAWTQICASCAPPLQQSMTVADPVDGSMIAIEGQAQIGYADTSSMWAYHASTWTPLTKVPYGSRQTVGAAWDPASGNVVTFSGYNYTTGGYCFGADQDCRDTWDYVSGSWTELCSGGTLPPTCTPEPSARHAVLSAWDPDLNGMVVYGGYNETTNTLLSDTWLWSAGAWHDLTATAGAPPGVYNAPFAYDASSQDHALVFYGGANVGGAQTWMFRNSTWSMPYIISGTVTNASTGAPISGVNVTDGSNWDLTDASGNYNLTEENGSVTVRVNAAGYESARAGLSVAGADRVQNFPLSPPLRAFASATPTSGSTPLTVAFSGGFAGGVAPYSVAWRFGDGATSTATNPSHTYSTAGTFLARFWVNDSTAHSAGSSVTVVVSGSTIVSASATASPSSGNAPLAVQFTGSGLGGTPPYTFEWRFGDGATSALASPVHTYALPAVYKAELWVNDSAAHSGTANVSVVVNPPPALSAAVSANVTSGHAPLSVQFNGTPSGGVAGYAFSWRFGDGSTSQLRNPAHVFNAGDFVARLWVNDSVGGSANASVTITSIAFPPVQVHATVLPSSIALGSTATFSVSPSGGTGDFVSIVYSGLPTGCSSADATTLACTPSVLGSFTVNVTATDNRSDSGYQEVTLVVHAPGPLGITVVAYPSSLALGQATWLNSTASAGSGIYVRYGWTSLPAGCSSANISDLRCVPAVSGHYNVTVTVWDSTGAVASTSVEVNVYTASLPLSVSVVASPANITLGGSTSLRAFVWGGSGTYTQYTWIVPRGCGVPNAPQVNCTPSTVGTFVVKVQVRDSAGSVALAETNLTVTASTVPRSSGSLSTTTDWVVALLGALLIAIVASWFIIGRGARQQGTRRDGRSRPRGRPGVSPPRSPVSAPSGGAPLPAPPPGYYAGVTWNSPRAEWDETPEESYGSYPVHPTVAPAPAPATSARPQAPPVASSPRPWIMDVSSQGIRVKAAAVSASPPSTSEKVGVRPTGTDDGEMTAVFEETEDSPHAEGPGAPAVTPDHAYGVLQALDRKPRSLDGLRQIIRLEDYWLLGLVSALVQARLIASGTNVKTHQTVFALTPIGRKLARRSILRGDEERERGSARALPVAPAPPAPATDGAPPLTLEPGTRVTDVQTIGVERKSTDEENPLEGLRPEDVNPQLKGKKPLPKSILQPMELRVSHDRGSEPLDRSEPKGSEARARELMIAARKAREQKARRSRYGVQQEPPPETGEPSSK